MELRILEEMADSTCGAGNIEKWAACFVAPESKEGKERLTADVGLIKRTQASAKRSHLP